MMSETKQYGGPLFHHDHPSNCNWLDLWLSAFLPHFSREAFCRR
jgi:hypothetical protein